MKIERISIIAGIALIFSSCGPNANPEITADELKDHVEYLASEALMGRFPGTEGDLLTADYIRKQFKAYGLDSYEDPGTNPFEVTLGAELGESNHLKVDGRQAALNETFVPLPISSPGQAAGKLIFVGYGFQMEQNGITWNDYAGVDVEGKIVLVLLGAPEVEEGADDPYETQGTIRTKIMNARDRGASGVILVAGKVYDESDQLTFRSLKESPAGLPAVRAGRSFLSGILLSEGLDLDAMEAYYNQKKESDSKELEVQAEISTDLRLTQALTSNVAGWIQASDTGAVQRWIVVGAHLDHLGLGGSGSGSRQPDTTATHYGADDNASGVASLIEIAGYFSKHRKELSHSLLFIAFAGEEMGLLGSKYFVEHAAIPLDQIEVMINLDMVGRLNEQKRMTVGGVGTAAQFANLIPPKDTSQLYVSTSTEGYGPSDHASFYQHDIPVLYLSTGAHLDYHTPGDTPDKLHYPAMEHIAIYTADLIRWIDTMKETLVFQEAGPKEATGGRRNLKVTLGIMPDFSGAGADGLRADFVTPGRPADKAGMKKGDRIVGINGLAVTNIYDYMERLKQLHVGQVITVEVVRNEEKMVLLVQL